MTETITFSRYKLTTFLACQRRFQLRYLRRLPWPAVPVSERTEVAMARGQQFHQLLQRHFLGLSTAAAAIGDADVGRWWSLFQSSGLILPKGRLLPELSLTIPIGDHLLSGRFDLLVMGDTFAHLFDWKTGKPQAETELKQDWQTRLYLAMLAEGGGALLENGRSPHSLNPDQIAITYWYVTDPNAPRTIQYSPSWHTQNWAEIQALVSQIEQPLSVDIWPLTDDWSHCRRCAYQSYCDRQETGAVAAAMDDSEELQEANELQLEPNIP